MLESSASKDLPALIIGEVLFDRFDDGRDIAGGAPSNVAGNLRGLGLQPTFTSAAGDDGDRIWNVCSTPWAPVTYLRVSRHHDNRAFGP